MSYILDALRKSERDRRAGTIPSLDDLPLDSPGQTQNRPWVAILIGLMIFINLVTLLVVFLYNRAPSTGQIGTTDQAKPAIDSSSGQNDIAMVETTTQRVVPGIPVPLSNNQPLTDAADKQKLATPPMAHPTASDLSNESIKNRPKIEYHPQSKPQNALAKPINSDPGTNLQKAPRSIPASQKNQKPARSKPVIVTSDVPEKPTQIKNLQTRTSVAKLHRRPSTTETSKPATITTARTKTNEISKLSSPSSVVPSIAPDPVKPQTSVPLLSEMSRDFQRQVPNLNINVFVYSDNEDERFVIINMVKYINGQKVREGPIVGDIRPDSVILNYHGRDFRLKRP